MSDFINTVESIGDEALINSIIDRSITEIVDDAVETVGKYVFYKCTALTKADFAAAMSVAGQAFYDCTALKSANFPSVLSFTGTSAFNGCSALETINFPLLTSVADYTFQYCESIKTVKLPMVTYLGQIAFSSCTGLTTADFPVLGTIGNFTFSGCNALTALILRKTDVVCTLGYTNAFSNTPIASGTGYIYVPSALLETYQAATNWSTYAAQFRALEDYTVDGTTTGELDSTKI